MTPVSPNPADHDLEVMIGGTTDGSLILRLVVSNAGRFPVTVRSSGRARPGLDLVANGSDLPVTLGPGERIEVGIAYRIRDCAALATGGFVIPVAVERPWGEMTVTPRMEYPAGQFLANALNPYCHD